MNGKSESTHDVFPDPEHQKPSVDTRAICDKLDFLGRFVVAGIVKAISQNCPVFEEETGRARWDLERTDEEALAIADKLLAAMKDAI